MLDFGRLDWKLDWHRYLGVLQRQFEAGCFGVSKTPSLRLRNLKHLMDNSSAPSGNRKVAEVDGVFGVVVSDRSGGDHHKRGKGYTFVV
jgi:hypothetical protein